jgi:olefin beta-lactone synthetase
MSAIDKNITEKFFRIADKNHEQIAVIDQNSVFWTFANLKSAVLNFSSFLTNNGINTGDRVAVFIPPSIELYASAISMLSQGITVVLIDPSLGLKQILSTMKDIKVKAVIAPQKIAWILRVIPRLWGYKILTCRLSKFDRSSEVIQYIHSPAGEAIVSYTSGTTGSPRGANRSHSLLCSQQKIISQYWPQLKGSIDMTFFPVLGFHCLSVGATLVIPRFKLSDPERGKKLAEQVERDGVTRLAAPPNLLDELCSHTEENGSAGRLSQYVVGGNVVSKNLVKKMSEIFPNCSGINTYGSTEVEPMALADQHLMSTAIGPGYLLGRPIPELQWDLEAIDDLGVEDDRIIRIGELNVRGPHVLDSYLVEGNQLITLKPPLKTGDIVAQTKDGLLWILGRRAHLIPNKKGKQIPPVLIEKRLKDELHCEVVIISSAKGSMVVVESKNQPLFVDELILNIEEDFDIDLNIRHLEKFPRDARQDSKIDRRLMLQILGGNHEAA